MTGPLRDRYRRTINYLRISVTDRCNLRCTYCMPEGGVEPVSHGEILSYEELLRVTRVAASLGITKVRVTGGEPLVRRGILDFIAALAQLSGITDLSLTTNGLLLGELASDLRRAGLQRVNVSLDTLRPDVFFRITRRPGLERVLAGLEQAKRVGLDPIKINVVALRGINDGELLDFADFASRGGYEVRFIEFMPSAAAAAHDPSFLSATEILAVLRSRYAVVSAGAGASCGPSRMFSLPGGARVGVISPLSDHFCGTCNRLRLTAVGRLRSCLFADYELDLKSALRFSALGDQELASMLRAAVLQKPERHALGEVSAGGCCGLVMNRIGG